ncbi:MAG: helix-turn-helix transcriptional regulator [Usitatibacter sp.]
MKQDELATEAEGVEAMPRLLRLPAVLRVTGLGRSTVYKMVAEHTFPAPVRLSKRAVGWRHDDVRQWTIARPPLHLYSSWPASLVSE